MKVIEAPNDYIKGKHDITCFLAGGITNCRQWQNDVIEKLKEIEKAEPIPDYELVIFNPRRKNFPIDDPNAAELQIMWEYEYLEAADIFAMYFCSGSSDQPICMYELGRNMVRMNEKHGMYSRSIITVENGYKRQADVNIQLSLTPYRYVLSNRDAGDLAEFAHANEIYAAFEAIVGNKMKGLL